MAAAIDKAWFAERLAKVGKTQNGMARFLDQDPSAMSRTMSGKRTMKMEEAESIARFLEVPTSDVMTHAGVTFTGAPPKSIALEAIIDDAGRLQHQVTPIDLPPSVIVRAQTAIAIGDRGPLSAAQIRANKGALAMWDDAVLLFKRTDIVESSAVGVLSIMRLRDGMQIIGHVGRARKTGEATVTLPSGETRDLELDSASPVLAVLL